MLHLVVQDVVVIVVCLVMQEGAEAVFFIVFVFGCHIIVVVVDHCCSCYGFSCLVSFACFSLHLCIDHCCCGCHFCFFMFAFSLLLCLFLCLFLCVCFVVMEGAAAGFSVVLVVSLLFHSCCC